jgi:uncharacterized protein (DUF2147 family)
MVRLVCFLLLTLLTTTTVTAQGPTPAGLWLHANGRIQLEITPCGSLLCGKLVWFRRPNDAQGQPLVDLKNPDPALRARPLLGLTVLTGLRPAGKGEWEDGEIYNPDDGERYHAVMSLQEDGTLHTRAYVVIPLLGKTQIWTRVR